MDKTYKTTIPIVVLLTGGIALSSVYFEDRNILPQLFDYTIDARINTAVRRLNSESSPASADGSKLEDARAIPGGIRLTVAMTTLSVDQLDREQFRTETRELLNYVGCFRRDIADLMKYDGIFVENVYVDKNGEAIATIRLDSKSCRLGSLATTTDMILSTYVPSAN